MKFLIKVKVSFADTDAIFKTVEISRDNLIDACFAAENEVGMEFVNDLLKPTAVNAVAGNPVVNLGRKKRAKTAMMATMLLMLIFASCSQQLPQPILKKAPTTEPTAEPTAEPCTPEFDPPQVYVNSQGNLCENNCHFVYEGKFTTEPGLSWTSEVNCVENPTNWTFEIDENVHGRFFKIRVQHPEIPNGQNLGLCRNFFILEPFSGECSEVFEIIYINAGSSMWTTARLDIYMSDEYWDCYDSDGWAFDFRVTARHELPIYGS